MGRMKVGIAVAGVVVTLLGVVAVVTMRSDSSSNHVNTVAGAPSGEGSSPAVTAIGPGVQGTTPAPAAPAGSEAKAPSAPGPTAKAPGTAPAAATPPSIPPQPSVQDIQQIIAGITAQVTNSAAGNGGIAPLTKEQIEAQVRAQLKQLGINL